MANRPEPAQSEPAKTYPNVDRLRADIDSGLTGDKIPANDPAAAPLGTDDEAAGASPTLDEIKEARRREIGIKRDIEATERRAGNAGFVAMGLLVAVAAFATILALLS